MGNYIATQGMPGTKTYTGINEKSSAPAPAINPVRPAGGTDPSSFGWKALDYKFGDRPLYQLMKNKATTGSWCGKSPDKDKGGMPNPAGAAQNAAYAKADANMGGGASAMDPEIMAAAEGEYPDYAKFVGEE